MDTIQSILTFDRSTKNTHKYVEFGTTNGKAVTRQIYVEKTQMPEPAPYVAVTIEPRQTLVDLRVPS